MYPDLKNNKARPNKIMLFSKKILWSGLMFSLMGSSANADSSGKKQSNILFVFGDDLGSYAGIYDGMKGKSKLNSVVQTPNFDQLADGGVLFTNAHVNAPSCTPCRSSILTGQYFYRTGLGAILSGAEWDYSLPAFPLLLEDHGYHIGYTYKVWRPGTPSNAPFDPKKHQYNQAGRKMNSFSQHVSKADDAKVEKELIYKQVLDNLKHFLADRDETQPFFYWFGPTNTHRTWVKGSGKKLWGIDPDNLKGKLPACFPDVPDVREDVADYLGEVQAFDGALGVLINHLKETGEFDNTLIVVSGDHGIPGFPHAKTQLYSIGTEVPLVVSFGDNIRSKRIVHDFVNLMDLAPTFLDVAGVDVPEVMTGKSIVPLLNSTEEGWIDPERNFVVTGRERHTDDANSGFLPYPMRAFRTKDYVYIRNFAPDRWPAGNRENGYRDMDSGPTKEWLIAHHDESEYAAYIQLAFGQRPSQELYDRKKDPEEINNVADLPEYAAILKFLSDKLDSVLVKTCDPRITGDGTTFDKPPYALQVD
jgi:uncharacterized sulfatase